LTSISYKEIAQDVLDRCVAGNPPVDLPRALLDEPSGQALFGILVEGLADRFEPALCDIYARLFSQAVAHTLDGVDPSALVARYQRVRRARPISSTHDPQQVYVLSRVTLGADVAVTSVLLDAAMRRFPHACIGFVGPLKNFELFAGDPRIHHVPVAYHRGGLRERLAAWGELKTALSAADSLVIDPDSRLTQLGLLPVCDEDRYHLFESRAYGGSGTHALSQLATAWAEETFGVEGASPYIALAAPVPPEVAFNVGQVSNLRRVSNPPADLCADHPVAAENPDAAWKPAPPPYIAVNLGVGENPAKRIHDPFEGQLLALLSETALPLYIDKGAGGEESNRVMRAVERSGVQPTFWEGSFAGFAGIIAGSRLYVGYDSAGQHVAAACGVPLITIFAGFPVPRMFERWKPVGAHCRVLRVDRPNHSVGETLTLVKHALHELNPVL
jgi:ADP-heptose:LPS heptosyltransferase